MLGRGWTRSGNKENHIIPCQYLRHKKDDVRANITLYYRLGSED